MGRDESGTLVSVERTLGYHPLHIECLTHGCVIRGTVLDGQFDWGGRLPKSNGGARRYPQNGWKSFVERKRRRVLDCKTNKSSRDESRS